MNKWIILLALLSPSIARANTVTPQFTQGSMNSTTTTTQVVQEVKQTQVFGAEVKSWSGSNVTPSGDIADTATTFSVEDSAADWTLEITSRAAGLVEQIDATTDWTINTTTTSLSVFSQ
jgi:hypothetical protein